MKSLPLFFLALGLALSSAPAQLLVSSNNSHEVFCFHPATGVLDGAGPLITAGAGGIVNPHGILDRADGILVASFGTDEVKRYNRLTGAFIDNFIPNTAGLDQPVYMEVGPDGWLYISSQGNNRILRFNSAGSPIDLFPFIEGGILIGPSGFDWSPDGSILYVAGRASGNILAYDAATGNPLGGLAHIFVNALSAGNDTFGLAVHRPTGDVFVATQGNLRRFDNTGALQATITIPGLAIGVEFHDGAIWVASNNNLFRVDPDTNGVSASFLSGATINLLNFFHFSQFTDAGVDITDVGRLEVLPGQEHLALTFSIKKHATKRTATVQFSGDLQTWTDAAVYTPNGTAIPLRNAATGTVQAGIVNLGNTLEITERDGLSTDAVAPRFYRVVTE